MKLKRVISGGQTGADQTGIIEARLLGLETGGWAPKGYKTEDGPALWLADYGLIEHHSANYAPRTHLNAREGDITVWFGNVGSPGYWCTFNGCKIAGRPRPIINPDQATFLKLCETYECMNVAGNRRSTNPAVMGLVKVTFHWLRLKLDGTLAL